MYGKIANNVQIARSTDLHTLAIGLLVVVGMQRLDRAGLLAARG